MACSVMAGDWGWRKERYPLHAMPTPRIKGLFMACNVAASLETWRTFRFVRHVNTPYLEIRGRMTPKPAEIGLKRVPLEYIFAAALDAPQYTP